MESDVGAREATAAREAEAQLIRRLVECQECVDKVVDCTKTLADWLAEKADHIQYWQRERTEYPTAPELATPAFEATATESSKGRRRALHPWWPPQPKQVVERSDPKQSVGPDNEPDSETGSETDSGPDI